VTKPSRMPLPAGAALGGRAAAIPMNAIVKALRKVCPMMPLVLSGGCPSLAFCVR
jgi:hypothetical protein